MSKAVHISNTRNIHFAFHTRSWNSVFSYQSPQVHNQYQR